MNPIREFLQGLLALFVDDELLAVGVLVVIGLTALLINSISMNPFVAGAGLLLGNLLVLVISAVRTAQRQA